MKLVQFLRPLFFVALGLHGLALFIPTGDSDPAVIEDIALDEQPESSASSSAAPPVPGSLPVPDPNVSTGTASTAAKAKPTPARTAAAQTANRSAAVRPAPRARPPVAPRRSPNANSAETNSADNDRSTDADTPSDDTSATNDDQSANANQSGLPDLSAQQPDVDANDDSTQQEENDADNSRLAVLVGGVIRDFPDAVASLEALLVVFDKSLSYDEAKTTDESAKRSRDRWKSTLEQQANNSIPEAIAITEVPDAIQISYPLKASENLLLEDDLKEHLSGREFSICLEEEPSKAEVGVVFDAQGSPVEAPTIIRSTGYMLLDEEIKAAVANLENMPSSSPLPSVQNRRSNAYILEANVSYDESACVSLESLRK